MADSPESQGAPRRPIKEYEDNHFHDEDEVVPPPVEEETRPAATPRPTARPPRKLPPRARRFYED
jgi:hypothetical protein